ncbi:hypothetical protein C8R44DRAFT_849377, partial [Mycena epipterygia]
MTLASIEVKGYISASSLVRWCHSETLRCVRREHPRARDRQERPGSADPHEPRRFTDCLAVFSESPLHYSISPGREYEVVGCSQARPRIARAACLVMRGCIAGFSLCFHPDHGAICVAGSLMNLPPASMRPNETLRRDPPVATNGVIFSASRAAITSSTYVPSQYQYNDRILEVITWDLGPGPQNCFQRCNADTITRVFPRKSVQALPSYACTSNRRAEMYVFINSHSMQNPPPRSCYVSISHPGFLFVLNISRARDVPSASNAFQDTSSHRVGSPQVHAGCWPIGLLSCLVSARILNMIMFLCRRENTDPRRTPTGIERRECEPEQCHRVYFSFEQSRPLD